MGIENLTFTGTSYEDIIRQFIEAAAKEMIADQPEEFRRHFKVEIRRYSSKTNLWSARGGIRRGIPFIAVGVNFKLFEVLLRTSVPAGHARIIYREYARISSDPEIGSMGPSPWKRAVGAMVAHEVAHAIQFWTGWKEWQKGITSYTAFLAQNDMRPHGKFWRDEYRRIRNKHINRKEFNMNDEIVKKVRKAPTRKIITKAVEKDGGRYVEYSLPDGTVLGKFFTKFGRPVQQFNAETGTYADTQYTKLVDARAAVMKAHFGG